MLARKDLGLEMKIKISIFFILSTFLFADDRGYIVEVGDMAPDFEMEFTDGQKTKLSQFRGQIVSWCSVCRLEMPHLEKDVWQKYKDQNVLLIGVDRDEPLETVIAFQKKIGTTYPLALDPGANIFGLFANKEAGVTRNVVIDKTGKIVFLTRLFEEQEYQEMLSVLKKLTI